MHLQYADSMAKQKAQQLGHNHGGDAIWKMNKNIGKKSLWNNVIERKTGANKRKEINEEDIEKEGIRNKKKEGRDPKYLQDVDFLVEADSNSCVNGYRHLRSAIGLTQNIMTSNMCI